MSISSGYDKFKDYHQTDDGSYKLTSRWTSSNTVELNDGSTVEEKFTETNRELGNVQTQINKINGSQSLSTSILSKAEDLSIGVHQFILTGEGSVNAGIPSYEGNDVPSGYESSSATIYKANYDRITVELHGLYDFGNFRFLPPAFNYYSDGEWYGWQAVGTNSIS